MTRIPIKSPIVLGACALLIAGCGWFRPDPPLGPQPLTKPVLELMPESADLALALPSAERMGGKSLAMVRGIVPQAARDWVDSVIAAIEGNAEDGGVSGDLADAMVSAGFAPDAPIGLYLRTATTDEAESAGTSPRTLAVAMTFTTTDAEKVGGWLSDIEHIIGGDEGPDTDLAVVTNENSPREFPTPPQETAVHGFGEKFGGYLLAGDRVIVGYDRAFVQEIADRIQRPMSVDYGTRECPAESDDAIAALVRADRAGDGIARVLETFTSGMGLSELAEVHFPTTESVFSDDPILLTFDWSETSIEIAARADLEEHHALREYLGPPSRVRLAKAAPSSTQALVSFRFNDESKQLFLDLFASTFVTGGGDEDFMTDFPVADMFGQWFQFVDDELTLALTGKGETGPRGVGMLAVRNRSTMSNLLLSLPVPGERVATFRRIDVKIMPNTELFYATARNTLVIGTELAEVKESLGYLLDGETSPAFAQFDPPIDLAAPRYVSFTARSESVSDAVALAFDMPEWGVMLLDGAEAIIEDVRVRGGVAGKWLDTRLSVHFHSLLLDESKPAPEEPAAVTAPSEGGSVLQDETE